MCGLAGYASNDLNEEQRRKLVLALGAGIDSRGGHAAGYISINQHSIKYCKKLGRWLRAKQRFITTAAEGHVVMMHARYATCGNKEDVQHAHPYAVKRNGQLKLWGAHNGVIHGAYENAKRHGRTIDVDSQEIFELIADKNYEDIQKLSGYGVVTWVEADNRDHVNLTKLTAGGDIVVYTLKEGGVVWASTSNILNEALKLAELHSKTEYKGLETGRVYIIHPNGLYETKEEGIKLGTLHSRNSTYNSTSYYNRHDDDYSGHSQYDYRSHGAWCSCSKCVAEKNKTTTTVASVGGAYPSHQNQPQTSHSSYPDYRSSSSQGRYTPLFDGPVERIDKTKEWWSKGKLHRVDGPAVEKVDGTKEWYQNGELHREDGPAVEKANGDKHWFINGKEHRIGGPAVEKANGDYQWRVNGEIHREDGPATHYASKSDDAPEWDGYYLEGKFFMKKEDWEEALPKWKEQKAKEAEAEANAKKNTTKEINPKLDDITRSKDHAFLRELKAFWDKNDEQEAKGDDEWGSNSGDRFLLRGMQG